MKKTEPTFEIITKNPDGVSQFFEVEDTGSYKKIVFNTPNFSCTCREDKVNHLFYIDNIENFNVDYSIDILNILYNVLNVKKEDYQITGSYPRSIALQCLLNHCYRKKCITLIPTAYRSLDLWNKNLNEQTLKWKLQIFNRDVLNLVTVRAMGHCSLLIIINDDLYLLDTSLAHLSITRKTVRPSIFGNIKNIKIINPQTPVGDFVSIQINGTCSYWVDSIIQAIMTNDYFSSLDKVLESIQNGMLFLESAALMSNVFDNTNCKTFIKVIPDSVSEDQTNNYYFIKIHNQMYGIRKICWNNKFINLHELLFLLRVADDGLLSQANKQLLLLQPKIFMHNNCLNVTPQLNFYLDVLYQIHLLYKESTVVFEKFFRLLREIIHIVQKDQNKCRALENHLTYVVSLIRSVNLNIECDKIKQQYTRLFNDSRAHYKILMHESQSLDIGDITTLESYRFFKGMEISSEKLLSLRVFFKLFTEALSEISPLNLEPLFDLFEITRSELIDIINAKRHIKEKIEKMFQDLEVIEEEIVT